MVQFAEQLLSDLSYLITRPCIKLDILLHSSAAQLYCYSFVTLQWSALASLLRQAAERGGYASDASCVQNSSYHQDFASAAVAQANNSDHCCPLISLTTGSGFQHILRALLQAGRTQVVGDS